MRALIVAVAALTVLQQANRMGGVPDTSPDRLALTARHDGPAILLRWDPDAPAVRAARQATLTIADGAHTSQLQLDRAELRSGLARYWPDSPSVAFQLETDGGASGSLQATVPNPVAQPAALAAPPRTVVTGAAPRPGLTEATPRRKRRGIHRAAVRPEETQLPPPRPRGSRWSRLIGKIPWWRKLPAEQR